MGVCLLCAFSFFSDNQYPDEAKREEIAAACNSVIQKPGGTYRKSFIMEKRKRNVVELRR